MASILVERATVVASSSHRYVEHPGRISYASCVYPAYIGPTALCSGSVSCFVLCCFFSFLNQTGYQLLCAVNVMTTSLCCECRVHSVLLRSARIS